MYNQKASYISYMIRECTHLTLTGYAVQCKTNVQMPSQAKSNNTVATL